MFPSLHGVLSQSGAAAWYSGLTDLVAVYQPKGAASLAASYVNLVNPGTFDAAPGTAPTFDAGTGWTFAAASTQYLTTGITPASGYTILCRFSGVTNGVDNQYLIGQRNNTGNRRFYLLINANANTVVYGSGGAATVAPELLTGVLAVSGQQGYRNGSADGAAITAWDSPNSANILAIGALQTITLSGYLSGSIQAIAICSSTQTAGQIAAASAAVALI